MSRMEPRLRDGIVALIAAGHANVAIADLLACSAHTVEDIRRYLEKDPDKRPHHLHEPRESQVQRDQRIGTWSSGARGQYAEETNEDIRTMLAADLPTWQIAKECRVSEDIVRQIRLHDCPATIGSRRVEERLMDDRPFRIGKAGYALRFEAIAASYPDCLAVGPAAIERIIYELETMVRDQALPDPIHGLLLSTVRERRARRLTNVELGGRIEEISARIGATCEAAVAKRRTA